MTRLDWEKANRQERHRPARPSRKLSKKELAIKQTVLADFAAKHRVRCFKCNTDKAKWAKSGISKRGPWIVCVPCVKAASR